jgi:uncharacterized protein (DUF2235 family)
MGGRNLVVLADGTGNSAAKAFKTNVWRLYEALDLNGADQIAVFSDGVGTSSFKPFQVIGLALGFGVKKRVLALYKFLCLNYEPGDRIYAFGFSRGAFTIRMLAGLIHREGLVNFSSPQELDRNAAAAYRAYREKAFPPKENWTKWIPASRRLRDVCIETWNRFTRGKSYSEIRPEAADPRAAGNVKLHFVGVWDTVAAYGLPIDELTRAVDRWIWPMSFGATKLLSSVERARQAFSIDDERRTFFPIPWLEDDPKDMRPDNGEPPRLRQVWFAGAHANVGGGYADDRLAHIPLCWMIGEAAEAGLRFDAEIVADYWDNASESGRRYDPRSGLGVFYRYHPRSAHDLMNQEAKPGAEARVPLIDASAIVRMAKGSDRYGPIALPEDVEVLTPYDDITSLSQLGNITKIAPPPRRPDKLPLPVGRTRDLQAMQQSLSDVAHKIVSARGPQRSQRVELMHDSVWWGRTLYYVTLVLFVLAGLYPLYAGYPVGSVIADLNDILGGIIGPVIDLLRSFLPAMAERWLQAITDNPAGALALGIAIGGCLWIGKFLRARIHDRARMVWNIDQKEDQANGEESRRDAQRRTLWNAALLLLFSSLLTLVVSPLSSKSVITAASLFGVAAICALFAARLGRAGATSNTNLPPWTLRFARAIRTNGAAIALYGFLKNTGLPFVFLLLAFILILGGLNKASFEVASSIGVICPEPHPDDPKLSTFDTTKNMCANTGFDLVKGQSYKIKIGIDAIKDTPWTDASHCAGVLGVNDKIAGAAALPFYLGAPAKRWWSEPYFRPIARIGRRGNDEYALVPVKTPESSDKCKARDLEAIITARKTGRLYLYVNDAVVSVPGLHNFFYENNEGSANFSVEKY